MLPRTGGPGVGVGPSLGSPTLGHCPARGAGLSHALRRPTGPVAAFGAHPGGEGAVAGACGSAVRRPEPEGPTEDEALGELRAEC